MTYRTPRTNKMLAIDYSFQHPIPTAIAAAGYIGVLRYVSNDPKKNLTPTERTALWKAGLGFLLAWETTTTRALQGYAAGASDASLANTLAQALAYNRTLPIFYAVDMNATWAAVKTYFFGALSSGGRPVRAYGSVAIIEGASATGFGKGWQSEAWSGSIVSPTCVLYQRVSPTLSIPGAAGWYDEDVIITTNLAWCTAPVVPTPTPTPVPTPAPTRRQIDMVIVRTKTHGAAFLISGGKRAPIYDETTVLAFGAVGVPVVNLSTKDFNGIIAAYA